MASRSWTSAFSWLARLKSSMVRSSSPSRLSTMRSMSTKSSKEDSCSLTVSTSVSECTSTSRLSELCSTWRTKTSADPISSRFPQTPRPSTLFDRLAGSRAWLSAEWRSNCAVRCEIWAVSVALSYVS
eukprot:scaffold2319_cov248-Pinguiococcus_pyrenoidosus.AAC.16